MAQLLFIISIGILSHDVMLNHDLIYERYMYNVKWLSLKCIYYEIGNLINFSNGYRLKIKSFAKYIQFK